MSTKWMMSIDPGYAAMGIVTWIKLAQGKWELHRARVVKPKSKHETWYTAVDDMMRQLDVVGLNVDIVVCEEMTVMSGPSAYATARTSLMGLAGAVGMWARWTMDYNGKFVLAPIPQWKGQCSKRIVNARIKRILKPQEIKKLSSPASHDWDAAGIGLWYQGRF